MNPICIRFLGGVLLALGAARAQDGWRLPLRGAAEYARTTELGLGAAAKSAAAARDGAVAAKVPDRFAMRIEPAPWVCQGELDTDQKAIADPVRDIRDVMRAIAGDVRSGSSVHARFPRVLPFGDLAVAGSWRREADGTESLDAAVTCRRPAAVAGEPRGAAERLAAFCLVETGGRLRLRRQWDAARGVLLTFTGEVDLVVAEEPKSFRRFLARDAWRLVAVREQQDADFRKRVAAAIAAGAAFVRDAIADDKTFLTGKVEDERSFGSGRLALALLTLLHAGGASEDEVVQKGFAELGRRRLVDTYSLATAAMALAARRAPLGEAERIRRGELAGLGQRVLPPAELQLATKWRDLLLRNVDPRPDRDALLRFNYVAGPRYDTSVQQYGLLGLFALQTCGVELPAASFAAAARQLLAVQCPAGGRAATGLVTYDELRAAYGGPDPKPSTRTAACRGFAYEGAEEPPFGSMTAAGVSGLLLARAGMAMAGGGDRALAGRVDDAVEQGHAWLAREFSVRSNPGFAERSRHHWYYWLYCLERACELAGIAWIGGRDWYYEGALQLLSQQQANGSFRADSTGGLLLDATCFAVLFLAKSTARVPITGR